MKCRLCGKADAEYYDTYGGIRLYYCKEHMPKERITEE